MSKVARCRHIDRALPWILAGLCLLGLPAWGQRLDLFDDPPGMAFSEAELQSLAAPGLQAFKDRAVRSGLQGCAQRCDQIERVFERLSRAAATQSGRAGRMRWQLTVVRLDDVDAFATPEGELMLSETFVEQRQMTDAMLAFVLAHEMAHSILQHERLALTSVLALLPRDVPRSAQDVATELDYNGSVRALAAPMYRQAELDADEHGLLLSAAAGYAPARALDFMRAEAEQATSQPVFASHPAAPERLRALHLRLPLAQAVWTRSGLAMTR